MSSAPFGCPAWRGREAATTRAGEQHGAAVERSRNPQESERGQACERKCGRIGMRYAFRELDQTIRAHRDQLCPATRIDVGDHPRSDGRTAAVCARGDYRSRDVLAGAPACGLALEQERLTSVDRERVYGDDRLIASGGWCVDIDHLDRGSVVPSDSECLHGGNRMRPALHLEDST